MADPGSSSDEIRYLTTAESDQAAQSMAEAFATDALSRYFLDTPDRVHWTEEQKWELHLSIMQYITYAHCMKGIVTTMGPDMASVALWMPPGANMDDLKTILLSGMWRLQYKLSAAGRARFFREFFPLLHDTKASVLGPRDADAYYLVYIGTKPSGRGRGYARRLIEDMLARADAEARPVYLESTSPLNVPLYRRCGFETRRAIALDSGRIPLDIMVREPRAVEGIKITERHDSGVEMVDDDGAPPQKAAASCVKAHVRAPATKAAKVLDSTVERAGGGGGSSSSSKIDGSTKGFASFLRGLKIAGA